MGFVDDKKNFAGFIIQVKTKYDSVQNLQPFFVKSQKITEENKCNHEVNPDYDKRKKKWSLCFVSDDSNSKDVKNIVLMYLFDVFFSLQCQLQKSNYMCFFLFVLLQNAPIDLSSP